MRGDALCILAPVTPSVRLIGDLATRHPRDAKRSLEWQLQIRYEAVEWRLPWDGNQAAETCGKLRQRTGAYRAHDMRLALAQAVVRQSIHRIGEEPCPKRALHHRPRQRLLPVIS